MKQLILILHLAFLFATTEAGSTSLPDSLFTDEYIANICITEPQKALSLLDEAEKKGLRPLHRIQYLRCLTYHNGLGQYRLALDFGRKAYDSDSTKNNPELALRLLYMISDECLSIGDYPQCIRYAIKGAELARQLKNRIQEANTLLINSSAKRCMGLKEEAEKGFIRALDLQQEAIEGSRDWKDYDDLLYAYGTLISAYQEDGEYGKAIALIPQYEKVMKKLENCPDLPEGVVDMRYASEYAAFACIYAQNDEPQKAQEQYRNYLKTNYAFTPEGMGIRIEYLLNMHLYEEALIYIQKEKQRMADNGEAISFHYLHYALKYEAKAYTGIGNLKAAVESYRQMLAITDSLNTDERQNIALELATIYGTNEKNEQIHQQEAQLKQNRIILQATMGGLALSVIIIWLSIHYLRTTRRKNRILANQIDELMSYRDELLKVRKEAHAVPVTGQSADPEELSHNNFSPDRLLFDKLDMLVDEEKLFLDPDLNRDLLIKRIGIPKNSFAQLIQTFARTNFSGYMNNKRLEYSIPLLRDARNFTIEAIALDSGFNNSRSYHRTFRAKFGITPVEYRENMTQKLYDK